jgi:purine-nucleoside/S-methyl-5'-thioadenosine phosphorylase / adenosine deaminase
MILPSPGPSFRWQDTVAGAALVCGPLERFATHFFTTGGWKLGSRNADVSEAASWAEVAAESKAPLGVTRLRQVHGRGVVIATDAGGPLPAGDILISGDSGRALAVQAADCVPLLIVDPIKGVVAAAHAGWRGMLAGVAGAVVSGLETEFGCHADDLLVAAGPSIGACCYEVGADVRGACIAAGWTEEALAACFFDQPQPTPANPSMPMPPHRSDHWFFDGWACTRRQLEESGIAADRIHFAELCTASHPEVLPSYRRDGARAGRIAGVIRSA